VEKMTKERFCDLLRKLYEEANNREIYVWKSKLRLAFKNFELSFFSRLFVGIQNEVFSLLLVYKNACKKIGPVIALLNDHNRVLILSDFSELNEFTNLILNYAEDEVYLGPNDFHST